MWIGSFLSNVKILAITKKWLYLWNYRKFFSSENFVGVLGIHIPCLDASQTLIWPEHAEEFTPKSVRRANLKLVSVAGISIVMGR